MIGERISERLPEIIIYENVNAVNFLKDFFSINHVIRTSGLRVCLSHKEGTYYILDYHGYDESFSKDKRVIVLDTETQIYHVGIVRDITFPAGRKSILFDVVIRFKQGEVA